MEGEGECQEDREGERGVEVQKKIIMLLAILKTSTQGM